MYNLDVLTKNPVREQDKPAMEKKVNLHNIIMVKENQDTIGRFQLKKRKN